MAQQIKAIAACKSLPLTASPIFHAPYKTKASRKAHDYWVFDLLLWVTPEN